MDIFSCLRSCLRCGRAGSGSGDVDDDVAGDSWDLFFELQTLQVATDSFSDLNKLGHGGFGPVYKWYLLQQFEGTNSILTTSVQSSCGINHSDKALISYLIQDNLNYIKKEYPHMLNLLASQV
ncbi:cysteine-rich receptor-like protein kinase 10 [Tanacetum coccineum]